MVERGIQTGMIEIAPLAFMRGRTLSKAAILLDEAQNATAMQMKMFLTRLGEGSRMMVNGDPSQTDLAPGQKSGLSDAIALLCRPRAGRPRALPPRRRRPSRPGARRSSRPTSAPSRRRDRTANDEAEGRIRRPVAAPGATRCRRGRWRARAIAAGAAESGVALARRRGAVRPSRRRRACARAQRALARARQADQRAVASPPSRRREIAKARLLGDIVLAYETVAREAAEEGKPLADHYRHLVVHGFLHLIGFDHERDADAERMEAIGDAHSSATRRRGSLSRRRSFRRPSDERARRIRAQTKSVSLPRRPTRPPPDCSSGCGPCSGSAPASVRDDIEDALDEAETNSDFTPQERAILKNVLGLHEVRVADVMVPRADIISVSVEATLGELLALFRTAGHSRLPVYGETLDDPRGMVHIRDFVDFLASEPSFGLGRTAVGGRTFAGAQGGRRNRDELAAVVGGADLAAGPVRAAVDAGARSAGEDAGLAHAYGAGDRRIRRHRRPGVDRGRGRSDRRRHRGRTRRDRTSRGSPPPARAPSSSKRERASRMFRRRSASTSPRSATPRTSIRSAAC